MTNSSDLTTRQKIGLNVKARREALGLSQAQLGIAMGFDANKGKQVVKNIERARRGLDLPEAEKLRTVLRMVEIFALLEWHGDRP